MAEASSHEPADAFEPTEGSHGDGLSAPLQDELEELRRLLLAPEQADLAYVRQRLLDLEGRGLPAEQVSQVLPEAIAQASTEDDALARALEPTIEESLRTAIQRDPEPFADALFPIFGPAIRKSIREALSSMMENINRAIENNLTVEAFRWRLQAWRTGQTYSEIVLHNTLLYRVEQVFLIDEETGLPLQHVTAEAIEAPDSSMVSGLLTALEDFAQDSFGTDKKDTLDEIKVGDLTVWMEAGPRASLAAVIRGIPAPELRETLQDVVETVHLRYKRELDAYDGDPEPLSITRPLLESALLHRAREKERRYSVMFWVIVALVVAGLGFWIFTAVQSQIRWNRYVGALEAEPGLVVTESGRGAGGFYVQGLRDPLATDPAALMAGTGIEPEDVRARWQPYQSLDSALVVRRASQMLDAPESVRFSWNDGTLAATGSAAPDWIAAARQQARFVPGVAAYDDAALGNEARARLDALAEEVGRKELRFVGGAARLAPGQDTALDALVDDVEAMQAVADEAGAVVRLQILGHVSSEGDAGANRFISRQRAEVVRQALLARGMPPERVEAVGTGTPRHDRPEATEEDRAANRSVSFRVVVE